jgi:hypothetical protein
MATLKKAPEGVSQKKVNLDPVVFTYISKNGSVPASAIISPEDEVYVEYKNKEGVTVEGLRAIRYCRGEKSIFVDEQSDRARRTDIEFFHGTLIVHPTESTLMKFMKLTNMNEVNKETMVPGSQILFRENNQQKIAREAKEKDQKITQLKGLVYNMDYKESLGLSRVLFGSSFTFKENELDLLHNRFKAMIEKDHLEFERIVNSDLRKRKLVLLEAVDLDVISVDEERKCIYNEIGEKSVIYNAKPYAADTLEEFCEISLIRDEYTEAFKEIEKSVKKGGAIKADPNAYLETDQYKYFSDAISLKILLNQFGRFQNKDKRIGNLGTSEKEAVSNLIKNPKKFAVLKEFVDAKKEEDKA